MGARAAVYNLIKADPVLMADWLITEDQVWPAQSLDVVPRGGYFVVMRWEEQMAPFDITGASAEHLTVWVHRAREDSRDYGPIVAILRRITSVLESAVQVSGNDGVLVCVDYHGMSPDHHDEALKTICKNASYKVVTR